MTPLELAQADLTTLRGRDLAKLRLMKFLCDGEGASWAAVVRVATDRCAETALFRFATRADMALTIIEQCADKVSWERFGGGSQ